MPALPAILTANQTYAAIYHRRELPLLPRLSLAVLICMDARIDPAKILGLKDGDAHVIRNAGGRAADALRSLAISCEMFGIREILVVHHTECGLMSFSNDDLWRKIEEDLGLDAGHAAASIDFLTFTDLDQSVRDDVDLINASPLIRSDIGVSGFVFDVQAGRLRQVV
jgi:carbonic anhydrase